MNIILVGYMGSGKTTLGKKLASKMNLRFIDTDAFIESKEQKNIPSIFNELGEEHFRKLERELIQTFQKEDNLLLSTGGGMPCYNNQMEELKKLGLVIYLKRPAKELANRIFNSKKKRPLTDNKTLEELTLYIEEHLAKREHFYNQAHLIVDRSIQEISSLELYIKAYLRQR
jgi:shikimate kinase